MDDAGNKKKFDIFKTIGVVTGVADGIVTILGMSDVAYGEVVEVLTGPCAILCLVLNLEHKKVSAIILGSDANVKPVS